MGPIRTFILFDTAKPDQKIVIFDEMSLRTQYRFSFQNTQHCQLPSKPISTLMTFHIADFFQRISIHANNVSIVFAMHKTFPWNIFIKSYSIPNLNPITIHLNFCNAIKINLFVVNAYFFFFFFFFVANGNLGISAHLGRVGRFFSNNKCIIEYYFVPCKKKQAKKTKSLPLNRKKKLNSIECIWNCNMNIE